MKILSIRLGVLMRALVIALWAMAATVGPAHACCADSGALGPAAVAADLDQGEDLRHGKPVGQCCSVCHGHFAFMSSAPSMTLSLGPVADELAVDVAGPTLPACGPYRPPRA